MDNLKRHRLKVLQWPSQSPDKSIIENVWLDLKRAVHVRWPKHFTELETFHKEEWVKTTQTRIERHLPGYKTFTSCVKR